MISTQEQLDQAMQRLGRMYNALASLRADLSSRNPTAFALLAEGPINQIRQLEVEIAEYTGVSEVRTVEADVWIRIDTSDVGHEISITRLVTALNRFRLGILDIANYFRRTERFPTRSSRLRDACDFRIIASEAGSLRVGLEIHKFARAADHNGSDVEAGIVSRALSSFVEFAWVAASSGEALTSMSSRHFDPELEKILLKAVRRLVPKQGTIELYGKLVGTVPVRLTSAVRPWIDEKLESSRARR